MFSRTVSSGTTPSVRRFSEQKAIWLLVAWRGDFSRPVRPPILSVPLSAWSAPKNNRAVSVRPEPSSPARPSTSPLRMVRDSGSMLPLRPRPSATSTGGRDSSSSWTRFGVSWSSSKAASSWPIILVTSSTLLTSEVRYSPTRRPLRSTVIRSVSEKTWSRKCETNRMATPSSRSARTTRNSWSTSSVSRLEVGSSSTSTRAEMSTARAIATIC